MPCEHVWQEPAAADCVVVVQPPLGTLQLVVVVVATQYTQCVGQPTLVIGPSLGCQGSLALLCNCFGVVPVVPRQPPSVPTCFWFMPGIWHMA